MTRLTIYIVFAAALWAAGPAHSQPAQNQSTQNQSVQNQSVQGQIITPRASDTTSSGEQSAKSIGAADWTLVRRLAETERQRAALRERQRQQSGQNQQGANQPPTSSGQRQSDDDDDNSFSRRLLEGVAGAVIDNAPGLPSVERRNLSQYQTLDAREIERTSAPVLVSAEMNLVGARLYARENSYTALSVLDGAQVEFIGTLVRAVPQGSQYTRARFAERARAARRLAQIDAAYTISRHEEGIDLSFSKFNVAYMISVYCDNPQRDERCRRDKYIRSLASNLVLLNEWKGGAQ